MKINVAIVDDNQSLAQSLRLELLEHPEIGTVAISTSGVVFENELGSAQSLPDVVLMDISMTHADEGILTTRTIHERYPSIRVVMFTVAEDDERVFEAFKAGAVGYLLKNEKPSFIVKTIVDVYEGGALMSPGIALKTIRFLATETAGRGNDNNFNLTERELDVLRMVTRGFTYQTIGRELFISPETVKKHMANIFRKLHVKNKIEAINKAKELL